MRQQDLPPDLRAALSLVLSQRKSYAALAAMLGIEERAVHDRAHAALALLAPRQARELTPTEREQVGEYLLGQSDSAQQTAARAHLQSSAPARAWAQTLALELAPLAAGPLPEIPAGGAVSTAGSAVGDSPGGSPTPTSSQTAPAMTPLASEQPSAATGTEPAPAPAAPAPAAPAAAAPTSRRGGAIVLGGIAALVIVAVALIVGLGGGSHTSSGTTPTASSTQTSSTSSTATSPTSTTTTTPTTASGTSGKPSSEPHLDATLTLAPPNPSSSKALGIIEVVSEGNQHAFLIAAEHLPPSKGFHYAAWLYNSPTDAFFLGGGPTVGSNGLLKAAGGLPANASHYNMIVLTEEHSAQPKQPGPIVLSGTFKLS
jgi:hypothetical protein